MGIEEVEIDGQLIMVKPPISDINVSETTVTYQDATGNASVSLSSAVLASKFAAWLSELK